MVTTDLRLAPAALAAWAVAALAIHLPVVGQLAFVMAGVIGAGIALRAGSVALVVVGVVVASVALSAGIHSMAIVPCEGPATLHGRLAKDGVETALGAHAPARAAVRVSAVACGGDPLAPARGTVVMLGDVGDAARDSRIEASGRLVMLGRGSEAYALLLDAKIDAMAPATGLVGSVAQRRADFLALTSQLSPQGQGLVPGMTFGDDSALSDVLDQAMKRTSLSHLTAISGSHITMMLAVILLLTVRMSVRWRAALLLLSLGALLLLVGPEASVVRAAAMATVGAIALSRGRPPQALPALATGIMVLMVLNPWRSTSLGFALSVAASAALVLVVPRLVRRIPEKRTWLRRTVAVGSVPLVAQLACAPIIVLFNPAVSLSSVLSNVLVTPAVPVATGAGMLALLTTQWQAAALVLLRVSEVGTWWIAEVAMTISRLPGAAVPWPGGWAGALVLGTASIVLLMLLAGRPEPRGRHAMIPQPARRHAPLAIAAALGLAAAGLVIALREPAWTIWQCDVGQGSATLVRSGPSSAVMIDVGPAEGRSQDCLARARVAELDLLVLTHPHADHVGNLPAILAAVPVREAIVSPARTGVAERLDREFATVGLEPAVGARGAHGQAGSTTWTALWPDRAWTIQADDGPEGPGVNDASVVLLLQVDGVSVIALGDLEDAGQARLAEVVRACGEACQSVDVAVVAHHGSRTQSTQLAQLLAPTIAVIPVGENAYGHPAPETIALYQGVGSTVLRTDLDGDVVIRVGDVGGP